MRDYELAFILKPTLDEATIKGTTERIQSWISERGGEVVSVTPVGHKRLAYPIAHQRDGYYVIVQFKARPDTVNEVERELRLTEDVMRYLIVRR
ncbi:MAG: 30S ribosomal protein S6 [Chloroflexi bacterium]|nr:30S ribosomal protein S6 [Chloroflexota bacterium]HLG51465.1 30S ribosomal protein S6 [Chloroflexota bacterium]